MWANSVAKNSEKGKVMITAMNVTEQDIDFKEENVVSTLSVVESSWITTVDEFNEKKRVSSQTRSSVEERVSIGEEVTKEEREKLLNLIVEHQSSFQWDDSSYGHTDVVEHKINTGDTKPIKQRQYRLSPLASAKIER